MSTYTTTVTIPLTVVAEDREAATGHLDALLAAILRNAATEGATASAAHVDPLRTVAASGVPAYVIQHTTPGHWQVASVATGKSVDGIDYTSFETAAFERDLRNAGQTGGAE